MVMANMKTSNPTQLNAQPEPPIDRETAASRRMSRPLPAGVPEGPILVRVRGRILSLTEKAIRTYIEEYGLGDTVEFSFDECLQHIVVELEDAFHSTPIPVSRRTPAVRLTSRNLVFTMIGSSVVGIRISLKYSSRNRSADGGELTGEPASAAG
jgi:hypothetical protein